MDLSDANAKAASARRAPVVTVDPNELLAQLGSEVASVLSHALERVTTLATTGKINRDSLRALRDEVDLARRIGIMGQQVSRFASGRVRVSHERLNLTNLLREALRQRGREIDARGIEVRQVFAPAEVSSDATLLFSLLQTVLDWGFEHAVSRVDLALDVRNWPARARLVCSYAFKPADQVDTAYTLLDSEHTHTLETMSWRLLQQTAAMLGLIVQRKDDAGRATLTIEFPDTLPPRVEGLGFSLEAEPEDPAAPLNSQPLAGRHVLVMASRRELRNTVREAVRNMGLMVDFVTSVDEAAEFCRAGVPHALVYESTLRGERFERLRAELLAEVPNIAFIELGEEGRAFELHNVSGRQYASVGRDAILEQLPSALAFEISRLGGSTG
jgi:DNA-binding transcriptional regulator YdaS (Cro superfamily)